MSKASYRELDPCDSAFRARDFAARRFPDFFRLVKDHCEVRITDTPAGCLLEIPVVRAPRGETFPERLLVYLGERNASPKGPGTFAVDAGCVYCRCEVPICGGECAAEKIAETASELVAQVERLGPKILNLR